MATVAERVKGFLETWEKRKTGELPMPPFSVSCSRCGVEIQGDARIEFTRDGLVCVSCVSKGKDGHLE